MILDDKTRLQMREEVCNYINDNSIWRKKVGEPSIPGKKIGKWNQFQFYIGRTTSNPVMLQKISLLFLDIIHETYLETPFQLAGLDSDGVPLGVGICQQALNYPDFKGINFFRARKQYKEYGLRNLIEGIPNEHPVLMVDDLISSKWTAKTAYNRMKNELNMNMMDAGLSVVNLRSNEKTDKCNVAIDEPSGIMFYNLYTIIDYDTTQEDYIKNGGKVSENYYNDISKWYNSTTPTPVEEPHKEWFIDEQNQPFGFSAIKG